MAFKQKGFNPGVGTGMGSAFTKKASPLTSPADKWDPMAENEPKFTDVIKNTPPTPSKEEEIKTDMEAVTVTPKMQEKREKKEARKKKSKDKKVARLDKKKAKILHGKGSEEYKKEQEKLESLKTGKQKVKTKVKKVKSDVVAKVDETKKKVTKKIKDTKKKFTKSDEEKALKEKTKQLKWRRKNPKKAKKLEDASKAALVGLGMGAGGNVTKERSKRLEEDSPLTKTGDEGKLRMTSVVGKIKEEQRKKAESLGGTGKLTKTSAKPLIKEIKKAKNLDGMSFKEAFRAARNAGKETFTWKGKKYTTKTK